MNKYFFSALMALVATGCTTDSMPLSSSSCVSGSCLTLNTRTPDASYEVHYYVADTEGVGTNVSFSNLPPGDYQIYAVSSDNLSGFNLPTTKEASPTAVITPTTDYPEHDLLLANTNISLAPGDDITLDLSFRRALLRLNTITLHQVPEEATAVSLTISPLQTNVSLDLTAESGTTMCELTIPLTKCDATTWQSLTPYYIFPSIGAPTLTFDLTLPSSDNPKESVVSSFTHTLEVPLEANHPITLDATYPNSDALPAVGSTYQGCYVLAVHDRTVTLLSPTEQKGYMDMNYSDQEMTQRIINGILASWPKPEGITGNYRLPTWDEAMVFAQDPAICYLPNIRDESFYYCMKGDKVTALRIFHHPDDKIVYEERPNLSYLVLLRPVIDITFQ